MFLTVLSILSFIITVAGFTATLVQLRRAKTVAETTRATIVAATDRVRYNQLLVLLPQLQNLEGELNLAIREDDSRLAERTLVRWNQLASQAQGIIESMGPDHADLARALAKSCEESVTAKGDLVDAAGSVKDIVRTSRASLATLSPRLGVLLGSLSTELSGGSNDRSK